MQTCNAHLDFINIFLNDNLFRHRKLNIFFFLFRFPKYNGSMWFYNTVHIIQQLFVEIFVIILPC